MNLIDKVLLEWSYRTKKGYPDINSQEDMVLFESIFGFNLNETALSPANLAQDSKDGENKGEKRIVILINKIKNRQPLKLNKSEETFLVHDPEGTKVAELENWDESKGKVTLTDVEGKSITTSNLEKTSEFGGGKGSGGGALNTDLQESAQCLVNAIAFKIKGSAIDEKDLTKENLIKAQQYATTTSSLEEIVSFIESREDWIQPLVTTANKTLEVISNTNFEFHRGSDFVNKLYSAWKTARKKGNLGRIDDNKWNPGDIWAVDPSVKEITFETDLFSLNNQLIDLYKNQSLIGISLKKTSTPNATVHNFEKQAAPGTYNGKYNASPKSLDAYLYFTNGAKLQLRDFGSFQFQGELKGTGAAGGKIGGGPLKMFLDRNNLGPIPTNGAAKKMANDLDDSFVERFSYLLKKYSGLDSSREDMETKFTKQFTFSKFQALEVLDAFETGSDEDVKNASSDVLLYAGSESSISSVYVKIK
tara:strand:+ start:389 stop:1816 length:1428 start_codon:yes stop_codon:yes gene_type:complete